MTGERGAASLLLLGVVAVLLVLTVGLAATGQFLAARLQASAAADAAALAAAPVTFRPYGALGSPTDEARLFARANGAELLWCRCPVDGSFRPRRVEVMVARTIDVIVLGPRTVRARSKADFTPPDLG